LSFRQEQIPPAVSLRTLFIISYDIHNTIFGYIKSDDLL
jgi:hypothetical protein